MVLYVYQGNPSSAAACLCRVVDDIQPILPCVLQDVANRSFLKSHALYKNIDNWKTIEKQNDLIAK